MAHIGLRSVERFGRVPDVLGGMEDAEGKAGKEVPRREEPRHGPDGEAGAVAEEVGDVLELWDVVLPEAAVLNEQWEDVVVLSAGVLWVHGH